MQFSAAPYLTYYTELFTRSSDQSLVDWGDRINKRLEHEHVVDRLFHVQKIGLG